MAKVDIRSKAMALLLFINFFIVTQIVCGVCGWPLFCYPVLCVCLVLQSG